MGDKTKEYKDGFKKAEELCDEKIKVRMSLEQFAEGYKKGYRDGYITARDELVKSLRDMKDQGGDNTPPSPWPKFPWW